MNGSKYHGAGCILFFRRQESRASPGGRACPSLDTPAPPTVTSSDTGPSDCKFEHPNLSHWGRYHRRARLCSRLEEHRRGQRKVLRATWTYRKNQVQTEGRALKAIVVAILIVFEHCFGECRDTAVGGRGSNSMWCCFMYPRADALRIN